MRRRRKNRFLIFIICVLAVPTCGVMVGDLVLPAAGEAETFVAALRPWLAVGTLLGLVHLLLRPVLRLFSAPVGCLTLGLSGWVIDIILIYACEFAVDGFRVSGLLYAVLTAVLINVITAIAGYERE